MRLPTFLFGLLAFVALAAAWSKEDREIFRIRDEIRASKENPDMSFYDLLGVVPSASIEEITKAYRKITLSLHPDKVKARLKAERAKAKKAEGSDTKKPGVTVNKPPTQREVNAAIKLASERQARLGLVRNILVGPERDRYDHFLRYGFPAWKGTNYYYDRYRPGLGTAIIGVFIFAGGALHYLVLYMSFRRRRDFVERYIRFARDAAWGDGLHIPGIDYSQPTPSAEGDAPGAAQPVNRRIRRMEERASRKEKGMKAKRGAAASAGGNGSGTATPRDGTEEGPVGPRKRVLAENGKVLLVDSLSDVYLEDEDEDGNLQHYLLDPSELEQPTFKDTAVIRIPVYFARLTVTKLLGETTWARIAGPQVIDLDSDDEPKIHTPAGTDSGAEAEDFELLDKSTDSIRKVKSTGAQTGGKASKRKGRKR